MLFAQGVYNKNRQGGATASDKPLSFAHSLLALSSEDDAGSTQVKSLSAFLLFYLHKRLRNVVGGYIIRLLLRNCISDRTVA